MNFILGVLGGLVFNHFYNNYRNANLRSEYYKEWNDTRKKISETGDIPWLE